MKAEECRVLVLKNDEQVRDVTKRMLVLMDFKEDNIFLAGNIQEAKEILAGSSINLVLSGIGVNEEEGPKILAWIEECGVREKISFIFYSGAGESYIKQKTEDYGADGYISVPTITMEFVLKIKEVLSET